MLHFYSVQHLLGQNKTQRFHLSVPYVCYSDITAVAFNSLNMQKMIEM